ncbi:MAG TPA: hypothetical protein DCZ75_04450 [Geobacter sp.]|nr:hypothetical protein [Geobacter sp.]
MGFFDKVFGTKAAAEATPADAKTTEARGTVDPHHADMSAALSMHLRNEVEPAFSVYVRLQEELPLGSLAPFFASAIMAGRGEVADAAEKLRALSGRLSTEEQSFSHVIATELVEVMKDQSPLKLPAVAQLIVSFGDLLKKDGFTREAAVCFEIAAGLASDNAHVLHKLGDTLHDLGMYEYAESVLQEAIKLAPNHWDALYTYAVLLQDLGRVEEAITHYEKAVRLVPTHVKCQNNFGAALLTAGRFDDALEHCNRAAALDPTAPLVKVNLGNIHLMKQEYDRARACFNEAISLDATLAQAYFGLGYVEQLTGGDSGRCREMYTKAIELNPSVLAFHQALGNLEQ